MTPEQVIEAMKKDAAACNARMGLRSDRCGGEVPRNEEQQNHEAQDIVLSALDHQESRTMREIADATKMKMDRVDATLERLVIKRLVERVVDRQSRTRRFRRVR